MTSKEFIKDFLKKESDWRNAGCPSKGDRWEAYNSINSNMEELILAKQELKMAEIICSYGYSKENSDNREIARRYYKSLLEKHNCEDRQVRVKKINELKNKFHKISLEWARAGFPLENNIHEEYNKTLKEYQDFVKFDKLNEEEKHNKKTNELWDCLLEAIDNCVNKKYKDGEIGSFKNESGIAHDYLNEYMWSKMTLNRGGYPVT